MNPLNTQHTRRDAIRAGAGFGSLLAAGLLADVNSQAEGATRGVDPAAPKAPHFAAKAKRVIFLYMSGGASHLETFDPKPQLTKDHGKTIVPEEGREFGKRTTYLQKPHFKFKKYGRSGIEISSLFPYVAQSADDLCVIRSMRTDHINHYESALGIHTGSWNFTRPSIGSWLSYGLGTVNQNLPSVMVLSPKLPYAGAQLWASDFLPGYHQGTRVVPGADPIANLKRAAPADLQAVEIAALGGLNRKHLQQRSGDSAGLAARIKSFETAFGMQVAAPQAFDLSEESKATHELYGLERGSTKGFAWQCLVARRLAERGVRFIELIDSGSSGNWDSHGNMDGHIPVAKNVDQPIGALLKDLKARGMLEDTLVVWTTEFGRPPYDGSPQGKGRGHQHPAFCSWLAGGGVKGGTIYGATDEYGLAIAENEVHVHDFHATILHLMGMNHERLTYRHAGRDFRLTNIAGKVVQEIIA